jgi:hypothetical protein
VINEEWQATDVVLVGVGSDQKVEVKRRRRVLEHSRQLLWDRRMARGPDLVTRVGAVYQYACLAELAQDRVAVFLRTDIEKVNPGWRGAHR